MKNMPRDQLIKSGEDPDDPGGYFIIKGTERVLIGLEDLAPNRIITAKEKVAQRLQVKSSLRSAHLGQGAQYQEISAAHLL